MKVLLMAYECSPWRGSEWAVGWGRLLQAARAAEVHVITSESNVPDLQRAEADGLLPANAWVHSLRVSDRLCARLGQRGASDYDYGAYQEWQRVALRLARRLHAEHGFDVAHQSTVCTFREPGEMWRLGVPFVWGPFGGVQNFPLRMLPMLRPRDAVYEVARGVANWATLRLNPRVRAAARHAGAVLGANSCNASQSERVFGRRVELLLETGVADVKVPCRQRYLSRVRALKTGTEMPRLRLLWSGQMRPRKALPVLLRALAQLKGRVDFALAVLGDGPELERWRAMAEDLSLADRVTFKGRLPLAEAVAAMQGADVFCFTSLRDTSGNVVLEALAAGVPVVTFGHQGAGDMVSDGCGICIPVTTPRTAIAAWANALTSLADDPVRLLRMSEGATVQAHRFLWSSNGDRVNALYRHVSRQQSTQRQPAQRWPAQQGASGLRVAQPRPA